MYKLVLENTGKGPLKALEESFNIFMYLLEPWFSLWPSSAQLTCRCDLVLVLDQSLCFVCFAKLEPASRGYWSRGRQWWPSRFRSGHKVYLSGDRWCHSVA